LFLRRFQLLEAGLGAFLFVGITARRGPKHHQREQSKKREEQDHADPRREHRLRLVALDWFGRGHG
jgi:hypothetical protein